MNKKIKLFDPVIDSLEEEKILEELSLYMSAGVTDCGIQICPSQDRDRAMSFISDLIRSLG